MKKSARSASKGSRRTGASTPRPTTGSSAGAVARRRVASGLKALRGQLDRLRVQARTAGGEAQVRLGRLERQTRTAVEGAVRRAEPQVRKAVRDAVRKARPQVRKLEQALREASPQVRRAVEDAVGKARPRLRDALDRATAVGRGLRAGVRAGAAAYRRARGPRA